MTRVSQRGSAMLITMILITALLAGAAVLISLQMAANRATDLTRTGISALYCAEAGLTATRSLIANNQPNWNASLGTGTEPSWLAGADHDIDDDGVGPDYRVTLVDNMDEAGSDNPNLDADGKIIIVSRCLKYPDVPKEVREMVGYTTQSNCYNSQQGGCAGNNNQNSPY